MKPKGSAIAHKLKWKRKLRKKETIKLKILPEVTNSKFQQIVLIQKEVILDHIGLFLSSNMGNHQSYSPCKLLAIQSNLSK